MAVDKLLRCLIRKMKKRPLFLLYDPAFLAALALLILNDSYLKFAFGGMVTGKLSDFAGLFAFPFLWSVIFFDHRRLVHALTLFIFIFWKLPISTPAIGWINAILGTTMARVVDYTDLVALISVPVSFWYINRRFKQLSGSSTNYAVAVAICVISLVAFVATSFLQFSGKLNVRVGESYWVPVQKQELLESRLQHGTGVPPAGQTMADTLFYIDFHYRSYTLRAKVNLLGEGDSTRIELIEMDSYATFGSLFSNVERGVLSMPKEDFSRAFQRSVIRKITDKKNRPVKHVHYWNARTDTSK